MSISKGWHAEARRCESPNFNRRPASSSIKLLVIHNISLPPRQFAGEHIVNFFQNKLDVSVDPYFQTIADLQVSSHFLIRRDGELIQFVSCEDRAWHAGESAFCGEANCNDFSIGIELEGSDDIPYEPAQYARLVSLSNELMAAYPKITLDNIKGHCDIAPQRKTDPGASFDWLFYQSQLRKTKNRA